MGGGSTGVTRESKRSLEKISLEPLDYLVAEVDPLKQGCQVLFSRNLFSKLTHL